MGEVRSKHDSGAFGGTEAEGIRAEVRRFFVEVWDLLRSESATRDEYERYVEPVYELLVSGAPDSEVWGRLLWIRTKLPKDGSRVNLDELVQQLRRIDLGSLAVPIRPEVEEGSGPDEENPEWTKEDVQTAMRFSDLPPGMQKALAPKKPRGSQKEPTKELISIRLSPDVLEALRAKGRGWQALADEALRERFVGVK